MRGLRAASHAVWAKTLEPYSYYRVFNLVFLLIYREKSGEYGRRAMQCGENLSKLIHFFGITSPLDVVWSHATNSKVKLENALAPGSRAMILEADASWGSCGKLS